MNDNTNPCIRAAAAAKNFEPRPVRGDVDDAFRGLLSRLTDEQRKRLREEHQENEPVADGGFRTALKIVMGQTSKSRAYLVEN